MAKPHTSQKGSKSVKPVKPSKAAQATRHYTLDHSDVPIRLFKSDYLEFFTHISPIAVLVIWLPVVGYFAWLGWLQGAASLAACFFIGILVWTITEYLMHRFVFHFRPPNASPTVERIIFLFHGVHHAQPQLKTRLVMPPAVSIPLAFLFYGLFWVVCTLAGIPHLIPGLFAGAVFGYVCYDMIHYATHHFPMRWEPFKFLKRYHMMHHFKNEDSKYGVSSPLWDYVFRTQ